MAERSDRTPRFVTLDVVRGVAVMGIFSVNVVGMAMIEAAYFNPPAYGLDSAADEAIWFANFVLVDHKMRSLFSILFGASTLLVIELAAASGRSPAKVHFARMVALLLFGLLHFYLIWWGDILTLYAVTGMIAFFFRKLDARSLLLLAVLLFAWTDVPRVLSGPDWTARFEAAHAPRASEDAISDWRERSRYFEPGPVEIAGDRRTHASYRNYVRESFTERLTEPWHAFATLWSETLALMLLGMAAFRSGFLTGRWSDRAYRRAAIAGLGLGGAVFALLGAITWSGGFRLPDVVNGYLNYSRPFGPVMALGYAALIILLARHPGPLRERFAAVGRSAFTNYLGASVIGLAVFVGLGLYGALSRFETWLLAPAVWLLMLAWSKPWLDRFRYGPFEWLWRSLARWELQPMRKRPSLEPEGRG